VGLSRTHGVPAPRQAGDSQARPIAIMSGRGSHTKVVNDGQSSEQFTITVFCGARCDAEHSFVGTAYDLGQAAAKRSWRVVYGGGAYGLMGALARGVRDARGDLLAIVPRHIVESEEVVLPADAGSVLTDSIRERKQVMDDLCDAFVALPGGIGTLEELAEIMTHRQLGVQHRDMHILDLEGFWGPLRQQFEVMRKHSLVDVPLVAHARFHGNLDSLLTALDAAAGIHAQIAPALR